MLLQFADAIKPYQNLRRRHTGLVVKTDDPKFLGRIKCKVQGLIESDDLDAIPWFYPDQRHSRGGRPDSSVSAVPPLYSLVEIEFPHFGDDPKLGGTPYYPTYAGMPRNNLTNSPIAIENRTPEDPGLSEPNPGSPTVSEHLETNLWRKTSGAPSWIRIDRAKGSIEFYDDDTRATFRWDRGGHLQIKATSLDVEITEDVRWKVGGIWHQQVQGDTELDCRADTFINTDHNMGFNAGQNIDSTAGQSYGITAGGNMEVNVGNTIAMGAGSDVSFVAGAGFGVVANTVGLAASGAMSFTAGGDIGLATPGNMSLESAQLGLTGFADVSIVGAEIDFIADIILTTTDIVEGFGTVPPPAVQVGDLDAPAELGIVGALNINLTTYTAKLVQRFDAFDAVIRYLAGNALACREAGDKIIAYVKEWAAGLNGQDLG